MTVSLDRSILTSEGNTDKTVFTKRRFFVKLTAAGMLIILINIVIWILLGIFDLNEPKRRDYPFRGIIAQNYSERVSAKWLSSQNCDFLYFYVSFGEWEKYKNFDKSLTDLGEIKKPFGLIHKFSFGESGKAQAEHFLKTADNYRYELLPAVDIRYNSLYNSFTADKDSISAQIEEYTDHIKTSLGIEPLIITDISSLELLDTNKQKNIWYVSDSGRPEGIDSLMIWQYTERLILDKNEKSALFGGAVLDIGVNISDITLR